MVRSPAGAQWRYFMPGEPGPSPPFSRPIPAGEKYSTGWMNMGFPPGTVAIAYERRS